MASDNQDLLIRFPYETNNDFTFKNISSEKQDLNVPFPYETEP